MNLWSFLRLENLFTAVSQPRADPVDRTVNGKSQVDIVQSEKLEERVGRKNSGKVPVALRLIY